MDRLRLRAQGGFTLIELLVVIAIIGILAAIAIPQFASYRRRGFDSQVKSDLRNAATAQEAYFTDKNTYTSTVDPDLIGPRGYRQSENVNIATAGDASGFSVTGTVISGCSSGGTWTFQSTSGQITGDACQ